MQQCFSPSFSPALAPPHIVTQHNCVFESSVCCLHNSMLDFSSVEHHVLIWHQNSRQPLTSHGNYEIQVPTNKLALESLSTSEIFQYRHFMCIRVELSFYHFKIKIVIEIDDDYDCVCVIYCRREVCMGSGPQGYSTRSRGLLSSGEAYWPSRCKLLECLGVHHVDSCSV